MRTAVEFEVHGDTLEEIEREVTERLDALAKDRWYDAQVEIVEGVDRYFESGMRPSWRARVRAGIAEANPS